MNYFIKHCILQYSFNEDAYSVYCFKVYVLTVDMRTLVGMTDVSVCLTFYCNLSEEHSLPGYNLHPRMEEKHFITV